MSTSLPRLSICIATFNRADYIADTLATVLRGLPDGVEVIVVDGASPDATSAAVARTAGAAERIRYFREAENSGVDKDYDKAVRYATGEYCWLMTDDDLLVSGAVHRVLEALVKSPDLVVVNAEVRNATLDCILDKRLLKVEADRDYGVGSADVFLSEVGNYLSFIGGVVIRRAIWLERSDGTYFGTLFAHMGVIFGRRPLHSVHVIAEPLIIIRYGNAMWTARGFEIWMFKFPKIVWSFSGFTDAAKHRVTPAAPWRSFRKLVLYRGTGGYSMAEYAAFLRDDAGPVWRLVCRLVALLPAAAANFVAACYCTFVQPNARLLMYDIGRSRHATAASRYLAHRLLR